MNDSAVYRFSFKHAGSVNLSDLSTEPPLSNNIVQDNTNDDAIEFAIDSH
jgi:hypothetical protein